MTTKTKDALIDDIIATFDFTQLGVEAQTRLRARYQRMSKETLQRLLQLKQTSTN